MGWELSPQMRSCFGSVTGEVSTLGSGLPSQNISPGLGVHQDFTIYLGPKAATKALFSLLDAELLLLVGRV